MAQDYDKIFKENIEEIILPLAEKLLNIHPEELEEIPDDLQITIERQPDFLKKVVHKDDDQDYILQIEFQTEDEPKMAYRMLEYYGILLRKYELEIRQYVFYIGKGKASMKTAIALSKLQFSFELINLQDIDYQKFIVSNRPEEVILAILANFGSDRPETVVKIVLEKLKSLPTETLRREKCVKQLEVLSTLRNLQSEIIKQLEFMAFTYNIEKDIRFQQGIQQGVQQGVQNLVVKLIESSAMTLRQISEISGIAMEEVQKIADNLPPKA